MKQQIISSTPLALSEETPIASNPTRALLWRTTMSVAPYFWVAIAALVLFGWYIVDVIEVQNFWIIVVLGASLIGAQCGSEALAKASEYHAALAPTARRRYLIQSIPGLIASLALALAGLATTYFEGPKGFLQMLGVSLDSPVLAPYDHRFASFFWFGGMVVGALLAFSCSYSFTVLHSSDTLSRRLSKLIGIGYTVAYGGIALCLVGKVYDVWPSSDMGQFSRYVWGHWVVLILGMVAAIGHYFVGWWLTAQGDKVQYSADFTDCSFLQIWRVPLIVGVCFVGSLFMSNSGESENMMTSIVVGKKMNHFEEMMSYREGLSQIELIMNEDGSSVLSEPDPGNYFFGGKGMAVYRPVATICFLVLLAALAFLQMKLAPVKPVIRKRWRVLFLLVAIAICGWGYYNHVHEKNEKRQLIDKAMNTMVAYRETPLVPKDRDVEQPTLDINDLDVYLNVAFVDQVSMAPVYAACLPLEGRQGKDKSRAVYSGESQRVASGDPYYKISDDFQIMVNDSLTMGPWEYYEEQGQWKLLKPSIDFDYTVMVAERHTIPLQMYLPTDYAVPDCPVVGWRSFDRTLQTIYWFSVSYKDSPDKMRPLSEVLEQNAHWLSSTMNRRGGIIYGVSALSFPIDIPTGWGLFIAALLIVFAYKGRLRPDGNFVLLLLVILPVVVWSQRMDVNYKLRLLNEETVPTPELLAAAYQFNRSPLFYPQIAESISKLEEEQFSHIKVAVQNLKAKTLILPGSENLVVGWQRYTWLDYRMVNELFHWLDDSEKQCALPGKMGFASLEVAYIHLNGRVFVYNSNPTPHGKNTRVNALSINSSLWLILPEFAEWMSLELAYTPEKLELIKAIQEKGVSEYNTEATDQLARDATRLTFTIKEEYLDESNAVASQKYALYLTEKDYDYLLGQNQNDDWDQIGNDQELALIKAWQNWASTYRDSCMGPDMINQSSELRALKEEQDRLMNLIMSKASLVE